ncbi:heat shock factor binding protein 1-domain-containing protein [Jackrogersella minutella]|nr:heat shock factor binding protein 1-domain-containing protein [Jackrogersella minutella]
MPSEDTTKKTKKEEGSSSDELTAVVEELLDQLQNKFVTVSTEMFAKMDDMTRRLDNLEIALQSTEEKLSNADSKKP